jgi:hypothetical protein
MSWKLTTALRPSDEFSTLDEVFHEARFGKLIDKQGNAEKQLNRPTHEALSMHRTVQFDAVARLPRESNALVTVESEGAVDDVGMGSYTIRVTIA